MSETIRELLASHSKSAPAIGAPDRDWLSYGGLRTLAQTVATSLHSAGIGRGDRVAIVLPNGPEMAAAFITIAQSAVTAPLNPAYREDEFAFYIDDLKAKAVVLMEGDEGPASKAAKRLGVTVLRLAVDADQPAGQFALQTESTGTCDQAQSEAGDVALILHTSGTTSRPKIVPLLQSNVAASAQNIANSLALTSDDRCMNVMPGVLPVLTRCASLAGCVIATRLGTLPCRRCIRRSCRALRAIPILSKLHACGSCVHPRPLYPVL